MKKSLLVLGMGAMLTFTACNETFEPNVDFGDKTYVNDYAGLIAAVNNMNTSLSERLNALNELLDKHLVNIKVSIDDQTKQIKTDMSTLNTTVGTLNTNMLNGFTALTQQQKTNGENIVSAINDKGDLLALKLDGQNQILSATSTTLSSLLQAVKDNTTKTDTRLEALNTLLDTKLENVKLSIDALTGKIETQTTGNADALEGIATALGTIGTNQTQANKALDDINTQLLNSCTALGSIGTKLNDQNTALGTLSGKVSDVKLAINDKGEAIKLALDNQGNLLKTELVNVEDKLEAVKEAIENNMNSEEEDPKFFVKEQEKTASGLYSKVYAVPEYWDLAQNDATVMQVLSDMLDVTETPREIANTCNPQAGRSTVPEWPSSKQVNGSLLITRTNISTKTRVFAKPDNYNFEGVSTKELAKLPANVTYKIQIDKDKSGIDGYYYIYRIDFFSNVTGNDGWDDYKGSYSNNTVTITIENWKEGVDNPINWDRYTMKVFTSKV